jgi:hypothetical protein
MSYSLRDSLRNGTVIGLISLGAAITAGCSSNAPSPLDEEIGPILTPQIEETYQVSAAYASCEVLGTLTATADCACYDEMSYEQVRGEAAASLEQQARSLYPDSDAVEVYEVDLYLNNAIARGIAYRCAGAST